MDVSQIISILCFASALAVYFYKGPASSLFFRMIVGVFSFIAIFFIIFFVVANHLTGRGISSSVLYYMQFGFRDAGMSSYLGLIMLTTVFLILTVIFCVWLITRKSKEKEKIQKHIILVVSFLIVSIFLSPVTLSFGEYYKINIFEADINQSPDFFEYYSEPKLAQTGEKKNLVYIYAESLERTYFDEKIFPGLIENLRDIENQSISFTNIEQDEISHHTIGGLVATQCGFPLISSSHANTMSGMDYYLGTADCLSDLLFEEGYFLSFFGGANLNFSSKGNFFKTHKFESVNGIIELIPLVEDSRYRNSWGFFDDTVLELAYKEFETLAKKDRNFALFVLTLDTHHPEGFISKSCENVKYEYTENPILDAVKCSDKLISEFVHKIRNSGLSDNTVIVISSDHLAMTNTAKDLLKLGDRKNLFMVNLPKKSAPEKVDKAGLTLDIGSTILPYLGFSGVIGFGRDINSLENFALRRVTLIEKLQEFYPLLIRFWDFPVLKNKISIDTATQKFLIDNRKFSLPALISFDENLKTNLYFKNELPKDFLFSEMVKEEELERYILIDYCKILDNKSASEGYCLKSNNPSIGLKELSEKTEYEKDEIKKIIGI
ncbi:MAG: sulfatase-like hydrolase/transferase [Candidatus Gracilibacteria bacterium]|jgi:phosphoglycerol transferase|nr:sulfatase-like hydrolase/transferase [Candidatus Gracilibacteria bacterium]